MSDKETISRRTALKVIAVGVGTASALPILEETASGQGHAGMSMGQTPTPLAQSQEAPKFFSAQELITVTVIADLIIPGDKHSPGAKAAGVPAFIDLMVSESSAEVKTLWRQGLAAVNRMSEEKFSTVFSNAEPGQQVSLLKVISQNEYKPKTIAERFFVAIKSLTVDGYYTSQTGIHQELRYQGNAYLKEFVGCTHPEHTS